jgi:hypothetical protein
MFKKVDVGLARDAMRRLQVTPLFDELTKRSLLARMVKVYPELESMIAGAEPQEKPRRSLCPGAVWKNAERNTKRS